MNDQTPETEKDRLKDLLRCCPPDRESEGDAEWTHALEQVARDPELKAWHEREQQTDRLIAGRLKTFPVPTGLREELLAAKPGPQLIPFPWVFLRNAAAVALAGGLIFWGVVAMQQDAPVANDSAANQPAFAQFSSGFFGELTGLFERQPEFDYFSENLTDLRSRMKEYGGPEAHGIPGAFEEMRGMRCRLFNWEEAKVALICIRKDNRSYHLFVVEDPTTPPPTTSRAAPRFSETENWAFASWGEDDKTYILGTRGSRSDLEPMF